MLLELPRPFLVLALLYNFSYHFHSLVLTDTWDFGPHALFPPLTGDAWYLNQSINSKK